MHTMGVFAPRQQQDKPNFEERRKPLATELFSQVLGIESTSLKPLMSFFLSLQCVD